MVRVRRKAFSLALLLALPWLGGAAAAAPRSRAQVTRKAGKAQARATVAPVRGPARIDFDDRLVQGQTNRAGAVYLFDRKALELEEMVKGRQEFRSELRKQVFGE